MLTNIDKLPFIKIGDFTLELELGPPSAEIAEVAKKELRESPELQKKSTAELRELLKGIVHSLPTKRSIDPTQCLQKI